MVKHAIVKKYNDYDKGIHINNNHHRADRLKTNEI